MWLHFLLHVLEPAIDESIDLNSTKVLMSFLEIVIVSQILNDTNNSSTNVTNTANESSLAVTAVIGIAISICVMVIVTVVVVTSVIYCFYKQQKHRYVLSMEQYKYRGHEI